MKKRQNITEMELKNDLKITLLPNQYMHFPHFTINIQKGDKRSHHKSFHGVSKPQGNPNEINYIDKPDLPAISVNHPTTKMPEKKVSFMTKLSDIFSSEKKSSIIC